MAPETSSLSLLGVSKRWPGSDRPVLDDIDLVLEPGAAVRIGGTNGAGKTTLPRIAAGLIRPEAGCVRLGALDVESDRTAFQRRVGFLSASSAGLYARLTVRDHLRLWSRLALMSRSERAVACERVLGALGLQQLADRRVDRLSMGQRQRARLAGTFLHDPRVVMLDEPTTSLDEEGAALLVAEVERVRRAGGGALWCAPGEIETSLSLSTYAWSCERATCEPHDRAAGSRGGGGRGRRARPARVPLVPAATVLAVARPAHHRDALLLRLAPGLGSSDGYFAYVVVGIVALDVLTSTVGVAPLTLLQELVAGTFERLVLSPFGPVRSVTSMMAFPVLQAFVVSTATLVFGALAFGMPVAWPDVLLGVPAAVLGALAFAPFGVLTIVSILVVKQALAGASIVIAALSIFAGWSTSRWACCRTGSTSRSRLLWISCGT